MSGYVGTPPVEMLEGDWVTWDFVTFYKQDGRAPDDENTIVIENKEDWSVELHARMDAARGPTNLAGARVNVWHVRDGGTHPWEQMLIEDNRRQR